MYSMGINYTNYKIKHYLRSKQFFNQVNYFIYYKLIVLFNKQ